ncbi:MAG: hypothetical protein II830_00435, partial [Alphaproteobacteria bacterium]|nr:hypothetical protein [Alphaproteobacteria bacterium]
MFEENKKKRPNGGFCFWQGQKDYSASLHSLRSFAIAHRHTPVCLSLVVKLSCRVRTFAPLKNKKNRPNGGFCFWQGQKDYSASLHSLRSF